MPRRGGAATERLPGGSHKVEMGVRSFFVVKPDGAVLKFQHATGYAGEIGAHTYVKKVATQREAHFARRCVEKYETEEQSSSPISAVQVLIRQIRRQRDNEPGK